MQMLDVAINQLGSNEILDILNEDRDFIIEEINNISR